MDVSETYLDLYFEKDEKQISKNEIMDLLNLLISFLPKNGKLYKYRSANLEDGSFQRNMDCLENEYLWMSFAKDFHDRADSTVNFDPQKDLGNLTIYIETHKMETATWLIKVLLKNQPELALKINQATIEKTLEFFDENGQIKREKVIPQLLKEGYSRPEIEILLSKISEMVKDVATSIDSQATKLADIFVNFNRFMQENTMAFCMADSHKKDNLWDYYADGNKGFCVEYDFNKIRNLPSQDIFKFLGTVKVYYTDKPEPFSVSQLFGMLLQKNEDGIKKMEKKVFEQITTKSYKYWHLENEWRLLYSNVPDHKLYAPIISALYIDESIIDVEQGIKLVALAKRKNWKVWIRKFDVCKRTYSYKELTA